MAHIGTNQKKILNRLRRIKGQIESIERSITEDGDCLKTLQTLAACRGAVSGLFSDLTQEHLIHHVVENAVKPTKRDQAALELAEIIRTYWK